MILDATAASYGFSVESLIGPSRTRPLVTARQVAMYLTRSLTDYSYPPSPGSSVVATTRRSSTLSRRSPGR